jgi:uncharacterized membrane protein (DUF106 family)
MTTSTLILLCALITLLLLSGWAAFIIRHRQMGKLRKQLEDLEKEMLSNHRELVNLETELARRAMAVKKKQEQPN